MVSAATINSLLPMSLVVVSVRQNSLASMHFERGAKAINKNKPELDTAKIGFPTEAMSSHLREDKIYIQKSFLYLFLCHFDSMHYCNLSTQITNIFEEVPKLTITNRFTYHDTRDVLSRCNKFGSA